jgi:hypothetical protein
MRGAALLCFFCPGDSVCGLSLHLDEAGRVLLLCSCILCTLRVGISKSKLVNYCTGALLNSWDLWEEGKLVVADVGRLGRTLLQKESTELSFASY